MSKQFYRALDPTTGKTVFKEVGTDRYIGPTEFGSGKDFTENSTYKRTADGGIEKYVSAPLQSYQKQAKFLDLVKEAINKKQNFNKDINSSETYWKAQLQDPQTFTDERLRLLDPNEQQNLREQQYATANAHLTGLQNEKEYRGQRTEDVVNSIAALQEAKAKDAEVARQAARDAKSDSSSGLDDQYKRLQIAKAESDLTGYTNADTIYGTHVDAKTLRVGNKQGGSAAWRNNNPGNIQYGDFAAQYGAVPGSTSKYQDGSPGILLASFPDEATGILAMHDLLGKGVNYVKLDQNAAIKRWSGGAYNYEHLVSLGAPATSKDFGNFTDKEWEDFDNAIKKAEQWKEGTLLSSGTPDTIEVTDAQKLDLLKKSGLRQSDVTGFTTDDWVMLSNATHEAIMDEATEYASGLYSNKELTPEQVQASLTRKYGASLDAADISATMINVGFKQNSNMFSGGFSR